MKMAILVFGLLMTASAAHAGPLADEFANDVRAEKQAKIQQFISQLQLAAERLANSKVVAGPEWVQSNDFPGVGAEYFKMENGKVCLMQVKFNNDGTGEELGSSCLP